MKPAALHERIRAEIETAILSGPLPWRADTVRTSAHDRIRLCADDGEQGLVGARHGGIAGTAQAGRVVRGASARAIDGTGDPDLREKSRRADRSMAGGWKAAGYSTPPPIPARGNWGPKGNCSKSADYFADGVPFAWEERLVSLSAVPEIADIDFTIDPPEVGSCTTFPGPKGKPHRRDQGAG
jgi:GntR family histidine utilization transcriptional repressor